MVLCITNYVRHSRVRVQNTRFFRADEALPQAQWALRSPKPAVLPGSGRATGTPAYGSSRTRKNCCSAWSTRIVQAFTAGVAGMLLETLAAKPSARFVPMSIE